MLKKTLHIFWKHVTREGNVGMSGSIYGNLSGSDWACLQGLIRKAYLQSKEVCVYVCNFYYFVSQLA